MQRLNQRDPTPLEKEDLDMMKSQQEKYISDKLNVKPPSNFEIFHACVNDLTGKDKIAKVVLYSIRLLTTINDIHGLGNPRIARSIKSAKLMEKTIDKQSDIILDDSVPTTTKSSLLSSSILNLSSINYILPIISRFLIKSSTLISKSKLQRCLLLLLAFLVNKLSDLMNGLSIYRHLLRAGTIPFRIWKFSNHIRYTLNILLDRSKFDSMAIKLEKILKYWTSKDLISQIANFWYAISDEILLIFRFKLLLEGKHGGNKFSKALFTWAEDHELYSWMATILLGLNNDWNKLLLLKDKESKIILNQKVRARTKRIVGDFKRKNGVLQSLDLEDDYELNSIYLKKLEETRKDIKTVEINSIRLLCDLIFDAKYIFHLNMNKIFHVSLGVSSGCLGLYNVWRQQRERLHKEAIDKAKAELELEIDKSIKN